MHAARIVRRSLVVTGVTVGLLAGTTAIRTAADWTAASVGDVQPPVGIQDLAARISSQQTRTAALRAQIERLAQGSDRLAEIIALANQAALGDTAAAEALSAELLDARARLAAGAAPAPTPARTRRITTTSGTTTSAAAPTPEPMREEEDHHDGEQHDGEHHDD